MTKGRETVFTADALAAVTPTPKKRPTQIGTMIGVRLQPDLLRRLDRARGGSNRAQHIRAILDLRLPK